MNAKRRKPDERFENIQYLVVLVLIVRSSIYIVSALLCIWAGGRTGGRKVSNVGCE
jgi:hypothetical protein